MDEKHRFPPFILTNTSLLLVDRDMVAKCHIFEEAGGQGWLGNGYDWTSIADVVVKERLPELAHDLHFDSEAGMFVALGSQEALRKLAQTLHVVFHDDAMLADLLSRAELD
jgi:hypothetical protein